MKIIDISRNIMDCGIYPGDPPVKFEAVRKIEDGSECNLGAIYTGLHNGTHVDAPLHFISHGKSIDRTDISAYIGECRVVEVPAGPITGEYVDNNFPLDCERILVKGHGLAWFLESAAQEIALSGVRLIGTDSMSVGTHGAQTEPHVAFLREDVAILENLYLEDVEPGKYFLMAQPLKIGGAEASPVRALLVSDYIFWSGSK